MRSALLLNRHAVRTRLLSKAPSSGATRSTPLSPSCKYLLQSTALPALVARHPFQSGYRFKSSSSGTDTTLSSAATSALKKDDDNSNNDDKRAPESGGGSSRSKPFLFDLGIPSLIPEWKSMFRSETLFSDISAGVTVGCIAVPLSLAIALASGVPAEVGLVTAAVSGVAGGLLGGTTLAVTGPAAAISLLVVGAVQAHGLEALPFITMATGGLQLASGVTRLGVVAKLVPVSVIAGFTTGVGTLILSGQIPKALGMSAPAGLNPIELIAYVGSNLSAVDPSSAALAIGTSAAMFALPKVHPKIPSALVAVGGATAATHAFGLDVSLIGTLPSGLEAFQFGIPILPSTDALPSLMATTLLIYSMTSVESLLSCAALEKMKKTTYKHNPDQELIGQGLANMGAAFFMGMPVTSVIARSGLNVRLGAKTRFPSLVQSAFVFSSVAFMSSSIAMVPMPALSGVLITTGIGMLNPAELKHCYAVQKMDAIPFATTVAGMLSMGLAEGIGIGCVTAFAMELKNANFSLDMSRMNAEETYCEEATSKLAMARRSSAAHIMDDDNGNQHSVDSIPHDDSAIGTDSVVDQHNKSTVWKVNGPINFVSMFEIDDMMEDIKERDDPSYPIVLDMKGVTTLEFTGIEELVNRLVEVADGSPIEMVNCNDAMFAALDQCDPTGQILRYHNIIEQAEYAAKTS